MMLDAKLLSRIIYKYQKKQKKKHSEFKMYNMSYYFIQLLSFYATL